MGIKETDFFDFDWNLLSKQEIVDIVIYIISDPSLYFADKNNPISMQPDIFQYALKSCVQFSDMTIEYFFYADTQKIKNEDIGKQASMLYSAFVKHFWNKYITGDSSDNYVLNFNSENENYELEENFQTSPDAFDKFFDVMGWEIEDD